MSEQKDTTEAADGQSSLTAVLGATMRTADTIERAIEIVRTEQTECQLPWGKSSEDLRQELKRKNIDIKALGVFIAGRFGEATPETLTLLPSSWMVLGDSAPDH